MFATTEIVWMGKFGEAVRVLREEKHMTQRQFAVAAGITQSSVWRIEGLKSSNVNQTTYNRIAKALGLTPDQLDRRWRNLKPSVASSEGRNRIPILAEIPAGNGTTHDQPDAEPIGYVNRDAVDVEDPGAFGLRVRGDSMMPEYQEGELIICSETPVREHGFEEGEVYAIRLGDDLDTEPTLKRVHILNTDEIELIPANPRYPRRRVAQNQILRAAVVLAHVVKKKRPAE